MLLEQFVFHSMSVRGGMEKVNVRQLYFITQHGWEEE